MIIAFTLMLAAGLLLTVSPWLWPEQQRVRRVGERRVLALIREAGYPRLTPAGLIALSIVSALVVGSVTFIASRVVVVGALGILAGAWLPWAVVRAQRDKRTRTLQTQWPDVCDLLVASVRAGVNLPEAVAAIATSGPAPLRPAFAAFERDYAASGHFDSSILRLKDVLADATADRIIESLRMARDVGGTELPSILRTLSAAVRAEVAVRGEASARQSWIRGAAYVGVVAPWAILAMMLARPESAAAYSSPAGMMLIIVAAVVSVVAFRVMLRIGALPRPRRWFG